MVLGCTLFERDMQRTSRRNSATTMNIARDMTLLAKHGRAYGWSFKNWLFRNLFGKRSTGWLRNPPISGLKFMSTFIRWAKVYAGSVRTLKKSQLPKSMVEKKMHGLGSSNR